MKVLWKLKAAVQLSLSVLPGGTAMNHFLQRKVSRSFTRPKMMDAYRVQVQHIMAMNRRFPLADKAILEIGPGWYSISGVIFWLLGVKRMCWVDATRQFKIGLLKEYLSALWENMDEVCRDLGVERPLLERKLRALMECEGDSAYFALCNIEYNAPGDARANPIGDNEIDLVYSYGVLEHIPSDILREIFLESRRILTKGGRHYHNIGLQDHFHNAGLGNGVNFLKYADWEWKVIAGNRFAYHNRMRLPDYLRLIEETGFAVTFQDSELLEINLAELSKMKVHRRFERYSRTDLAFSHLFVEFASGSKACPISGEN
jgi:hypothetical protein